MQLTPGTQLQGGKYVIEAELGSGGFGTTYRATQVIATRPTRETRTVVLKEYLPRALAWRDPATSGLVIDPTNRAAFDAGLKKFVREGRILMEVAHPNIVRVYELFEEKNTAYLVMEHLTGGDLATFLSRQDRPLDEARTRAVVDGVVGALERLHRNAPPVYHLDIKPQNIMLRGDGSPVLIDFGAARLGEHLTRTNHAFTLNFAPPELLTHGEPGPESDIFEMGVLLHLLLTGQLPPNAMARAQEAKGQEWRPNLPEPWRTLVASALEIKQDRRPGDIRAWWQTAAAKPAPQPALQPKPATPENPRPTPPKPTPPKPTPTGADDPTQYLETPRPARPPRQLSARTKDNLKTWTIAITFALAVTGFVFLLVRFIPSGENGGPTPSPTPTFNFIEQAVADMEARKEKARPLYQHALADVPSTPGTSPASLYAYCRVKAHFADIQSVMADAASVRASLADARAVAGRFDGGHLAEHFESLCSVAISLAKSGDKPAAQSAWEEAAKVGRGMHDPYYDNVPILATLSVTQAKMGDGPGAIRSAEEAYQRASRLTDPHRTYALTELAGAEAQIGDYSAARRTALALSDPADRCITLARIADAAEDARHNANMETNDRLVAVVEENLKEAQQVITTVTNAARQPDAYFHLAAALAHGGKTADAHKIADRIVPVASRVNAWSDIAVYEAVYQEKEAARKTIADVERELTTPDIAIQGGYARCRVALAQILLHDLKSAGQTGDALPPGPFRTRFQTQLAVAQAQAGDLNGAQTTISAIADVPDRMTAYDHVIQAITSPSTYPKDQLL